MGILSAKYHEKESMKSLIYEAIKENADELNNEYSRYNRAQAEAISFKLRNSVTDMERLLKVKIHETKIAELKHYIGRLNNILLLVSYSDLESYQEAFKNFLNDLKDESITFINNQGLLSKMSMDMIANDPRYHVNFRSRQEYETNQQNIKNQQEDIEQIYNSGVLKGYATHDFEPLLLPDPGIVFKSLYEPFSNRKTRK